jgi:hypothetical protein
MIGQEQMRKFNFDKFLIIVFVFLLVFSIIEPPNVANAQVDAFLITPYYGKKTRSQDLGVATNNTYRSQ